MRSFKQKLEHSKSKTVYIILVTFANP